MFTLKPIFTYLKNNTKNNTNEETGLAALMQQQGTNKQSFDYDSSTSPPVAEDRPVQKLQGRQKGYKAAPKNSVDLFFFFFFFFFRPKFLQQGRQIVTLHHQKYSFILISTPFAL